MVGGRVFRCILMQRPRPKYVMPGGREQALRGVLRRRRQSRMEVRADDGERPIAQLSYAMQIVSCRVAREQHFRQKTRPKHDLCSTTQRPGNLDFSQKPNSLSLTSRFLLSDLCIDSQFSSEQSTWSGRSIGTKCLCIARTKGHGGKKSPLLRLNHLSFPSRSPSWS